MILASPFHTARRFALQAWGALSGRGAAGQLARERSVFHLAWLVVRAYASALRALPPVLRDRWRDRHLRRLSSAGFRRLLGEFRLSAREVALKD
jgi:hypothetical protein